MLSILLALLITTQANAFSRAPAPIPIPIPSPSPIAEPVIIPSGTPGKIQFAPVEYYTTKAERLKIASAGQKLNEVVQSQCFHDFMASRKLIQTHGLTPEQVALTLQRTSGTVPVKFYYARFSSAVAYRSPPAMEININRKYFGSTSPDCELASTFGHESLGHALNGFDHDYKWNAQRDFSVPYSINAAFTKCCK